MDIERKALYNSLRMNWVLNPTIEVEPWQVEDYRSLPLDTIFERLEDHEIYLDRSSFIAFAENVDSPEELTDGLLGDSNVPPEVQDLIYLLLFELWRRLLPEKPSLSILCDELDYYIHLYDRGETENPEPIQDVLATLLLILDENLDEGADPLEVFDSINSKCANDIESFLYDFIAEQIDHKNYSYASELLDGFSEYVHDTKWFDFLRARVQSKGDLEETTRLINILVEDALKESDLEFNLELMSFLTQIGDEKTFRKILEKSIQLLELEEDFDDLLSICIDFYHRLDREDVERNLSLILNRRSSILKKKPFDQKNPEIAFLFKAVQA